VLGFVGVLTLGRYMEGGLWFFPTLDIFL
jgi:hypothetical protein